MLSATLQAGESSCAFFERCKRLSEGCAFKDQVVGPEPSGPPSQGEFADVMISMTLISGLHDQEVKSAVLRTKDVHKFRVNDFLAL